MNNIVNYLLKNYDKMYDNVRKQLNKLGPCAKDEGADYSAVNMEEVFETLDDKPEQDVKNYLNDHFMDIYDYQLHAGDWMDYFNDKEGK